jgi:hypothetical protein
VSERYELDDGGRPVILATVDEFQEFAAGNEALRKAAMQELAAALEAPPIGVWQPVKGAQLLEDMREAMRRVEAAYYPQPRYTPEDLRRFSQALQPSWDAITTAATRAHAGWRGVRDALRDAGLVPDEPPTDPRERALWARRNRNHGPEQPGPQNRRRNR